MIQQKVINLLLKLGKGENGKEGNFVKILTENVKRFLKNKFYKIEEIDDNKIVLKSKERTRKFNRQIIEYLTKNLIV